MSISSASTLPPSPAAGTAPDTDAYVRAALALQGYDTAVVPAAAVAEQFGRIAAMAASLRDLPLPREADAAPAFRP
jgi:hypothetical protein